ncbi:hypothetical protein DL765_010664 [Monosporascus sp. GIB2]|nr:hypothetical protein DL765_010664 [Monosporascus sp. GIB2]
MMALSLFFHIFALTLLVGGMPTLTAPVDPIRAEGASTSNATSINANIDARSPNGTVTADEDFPTEVRAVATFLAIACSILVTATYAVLIRPGSRLLSTSKIPFEAVRSNIGTLLSAAWPDTSSAPAGAQPKTTDDAIKLFHAGKLDGEEQAAARGLCQMAGTPGPDKSVTTPSMWLATGSQLTNSMVQLSVWEWAGTWVGLAMLISTLTFNGFFTNTRGPDSYPRLVVMLIYCVAYCVHANYVRRTLSSFFTLVAAGSSWSLLHKASFVSVDPAQLQRRYQDPSGPSPVFKQVGKPSSSDFFPVFPTCLLQDIGKLDPVTKEELSDTQKSEAATVATWQKRDITSCVEAGKVALDRTVTNVMTMLGVIISTGFSGWTARNVETSQLGSMALLASLTLGVGAMFGGAVELSVMDASFRNVLFLKEVMINGDASAHVSKAPSKKRTLGFSHGTVGMKRVGVRSLMRLSSVATFLLFGPAFVLLPIEADHQRQSAEARFEFTVKVRGKNVVFTTQPTSLRSSSKVDGQGFINVCYTEEQKKTV